MKFSVVILLFGIFIKSTDSAFGDCPLKLERIGCYRDDVRDRAMPVEIMNAKDVKSRNYRGTLVGWNNYEKFIEEFMCTCAMVAFSRGFKVIGLQFYAECWSSMLGHVDFDRHGEKETCVNGNFKRCEDTDLICMGERQANFIYRIAPTHCGTYYKPLGCYKDLGNLPRPLPNYSHNERDYSIPNWNGILIDWKNWDTFSPYMVCRCAAKAKSIGHRYFALQFYGECWTGLSNNTSYMRDGPSRRCVAAKFDPPNVHSYIAVGQDHVNYIYELGAGIEMPVFQPEPNHSDQRIT